MIKLHAPLAIFFLLLLLTSSCKKDDDSPASNRMIESFTQETFLRFNTDWNAENFILNADKSVTLVGNGIPPQPTIVKEPFVLNLDEQKNIKWSTFTKLDDSNIYRPIEIIPTRDGNQLILTHANQGGNTSQNTELIKIDQAGQLLWRKTIELNDLGDSPSGIVQLMNGEFIVLCKIQGVSLSSPSNQMRLISVSESGDLLWSKLIQDEDILHTRQLYYLEHDNTLVGLSVHRQRNNTELHDIKIHKIDLNGDLISSQTIISSVDIWLMSSQLIYTQNQELFLTYSKYTGGLPKNYDTVLAKLDLNGNLEWEKTFEGKSTDIPESLISTNDNNLLLLSSTTSFGNGEFDIMLSKLTSDGDITWDKVYGSISSDLGASLLQRPNGNIVILGNTNHENSTTAIFDLLILETDAEGNPL